MNLTWLKVTLFTGLYLATSVLHAEECCDAMSHLVRAITLCPTPNNPLTDGLQKLGGHLFQNVQIRRATPSASSVFITADVFWSLGDFNRAVGAPSYRVGKIKLEMGYRRSGVADDILYCVLKTSKVRD